MRSVPHRVVCLLGLDDGAFPRKAPRDGDDLMLDDPHVGDRDARTEDRQLLLDALMAATDRLIITYTGNDERTNAAAAAGGAGRRAARRDRPTSVDAATRERRRPPSAAAVRPAQLRRRRARARRSRGASTASTLDGARALAGARAGAGAVPRRRRCRRSTRRVVELDDLVRFVEHPVRAFLRQRLGISVGDYADEVDDALPVELDGLEQLGGRPAAARRAAGRRRARARRSLAEIARGTLPPGELGAAGASSEVGAGRRGDRRAARGAAGGRRRRRSTSSVALPDGRALSGTVAGRRAATCCGPSPTRASAPRHRLAAWVRLLALTAAHPERRVRGASTIGRARAGADAARRRSRASPPLDAPTAALRRTSTCSSTSTTAGCASRCRSPAATSAAYAAAARAGGDPVARPGASGSRRGASDSEDREPEHHARARRRAHVRRAARRAAARRRAGEAGIRPSRRASAATRGGCGTALLAVEEVGERPR